MSESMTDTVDPEIEAMARAIFEAGATLGGRMVPQWDAQGKSTQALYRKAAAAARDASRKWMRENGLYVINPQELQIWGFRKDKETP